MEFITEIINWITSHLPQLLEIVGAFAVIATFTKNKSDDEIVNAILKAINFLGGNLGKAENK